MKTVIVSGVIANKLHNGGAAWTRLSWAVGLALLGYRVVFIEQIASANCVDDNGRPCEFHQSANLRHFQQATGSRQLEASLICDDGKHVAGLGLAELSQAVAEADFLLNISGHLSLPSLLEKARRRVYLDVDPGYTQHWFEQGHLRHLKNHEHFFTVGLNIGKPGCTVPTCKLNWQPILQPVVLSDWPAMPPKSGGRFTTIASWRGPFGAIELDGRRLGPKAHEFRKYLDLPNRLARQMEISLDIDPADVNDRESLLAGGWKISDPKIAAGTTDAFRRYVQQSAGEFSVAQGIYVQTRSGWFSDRTVRYLASGKPAVVQETGFSGTLPVGRGLLSFSNPEQAIEAMVRVNEDYAGHCAAARSLAETSFDSAKVLTGLIERIE